MVVVEFSSIWDFREIGGDSGGAALISAYFDESAENDSKNGLLAVSGYMLDVDGTKGLIDEWKKMLDAYQLPFFHMSECNNRSGIYHHLTEKDCDLCAREAIRIARKYPMHGHSAILDQSVYRVLLQDEGFDCDPYTFLVWTAFIHVNKWVHQNLPDKRISLFFESGYKTQSRANELLHVVTDEPLSSRNRVGSYAFVDKKDSEPSQAADLITWHVRKGYENMKNGKPIRKDTRALINDRRILVIEYTEDRLRMIRDDFVRISDNLKAASSAIFSLPPPGI